MRTLVAVAILAVIGLSGCSGEDPFDTGPTRSAAPEALGITTDTVQSAGAPVAKQEAPEPAPEPAPKREKAKAGVTGRLFLPNDWTFNTNYVYNDAVLGYGTTPFDAHSFNRLDLTIAKKIADGRGELMIGMSDILNKTNKVVLDIGELTGHETPGRIFFARLLLKF